MLFFFLTEHSSIQRRKKKPTINVSIFILNPYTPIAIFKALVLYRPINVVNVLAAGLMVYSGVSAEIESGSWSNIPK